MPLVWRALHGQAIERGGLGKLERGEGRPPPEATRVASLAEGMEPALRDPGGVPTELPR